MYSTATPQRLRRALRERDEPCLAFLNELSHSPDALFDGHVRIDARHAKDVERLDAEIFQALLAGLTQIERIAATACALRTAMARAAALRMNDHLTPAPADRFADQAMIVPLAVAGRCIQQINAEIECAANSGDRLRVIRRSIGARHAVTAETNS